MIEIIGKSILQHGPESSRVYLMELSPSEFPNIIGQMDALAKTNGYGKIFAKISARYAPAFIMAGYETEAFVPGFYLGSEDAFFMAKYFDPKRKKVNQQEMQQFQKLLDADSRPELSSLDASYKMRKLVNTDIPDMSTVFSNVFDSYPFPIFDTEFLKKEMSEQTRYFGIFQNDKLVAISSAECNERYKNAEMTDFAVLPSQRGKKLASHLLHMMEEYLVLRGYLTFYTIARLKSLSMNKTFLNNGYSYSGTLFNNTQIAGQIESMNIWYKRII
ncbi:putative beta-lysine N-acetyltransferase [Thermophagus sp. OGC60D27]|uniref:putative beta-lysine N-acetyltransferase n=1 Tax=Thermophagus sp. OGC60D27 TaxID=3458415 RepID=UPI004037F7AD